MAGLLKEEPDYRSGGGVMTNGCWCLSKLEQSERKTESIDMRSVI
jgi:hypothetical protein